MFRRSPFALSLTIVLFPLLSLFYHHHHLLFSFVQILTIGSFYHAPKVRCAPPLYPHSFYRARAEKNLVSSLSCRFGQGISLATSCHNSTFSRFHVLSFFAVFLPFLSARDPFKILFANIWVISTILMNEGRERERETYLLTMISREIYLLVTYLSGYYIIMFIHSIIE